MMASLLKFLTSEWMIGAALTILFIAAYLGDWSNLRAMEYFTYDLRAPLRANHVPSNDIEIVAVDNESIAKIGRWPWPRSLMGRLIDNLKASGARVIGVDFLFSEPERSQGIEELRAIRQRLVFKAQSFRGRRGFSRIKAVYQGVLEDLGETEARLDQDAQLAAALVNSPQVVLPIQFEIGKPSGKAGTEPSQAILDSAFNTIDNLRELSAYPVMRSKDLMAPLPTFQQPGIGFGHINVVPDSDGVVRREALLLEYRDHLYPSFALRAVSAYLGATPQEVRIWLGQYISIGDIRIPTDDLMRMQVSYNGRGGSFKAFSAHHVLNGKIPPATFKDKLVLIGPLADGITKRYETPLAGSIAGVQLHANVIQNILDQQFLVVPTRAKSFEFVTLILVGLFLVGGLPMLGNKWSSIASSSLLVGYVGFAAFVFASHGFVITVMHPALLLLVGYTVITTKRVVSANHGLSAEADVIETNKMLGLSFQGQGMLDLAFEKFSKCPLDRDMQRLMYLLGMDFERKRMYKKAVAVYEYIGAKSPQYKDIESRIARLKQLDEAALMGTSMQTGRPGSLLVEGSGVHPTLGRYEVIQELGRGAMGVVYLGKDPKIQRSVAIKTMRLDEIDPEQLPEFKKRFFREALSAGKLSHPNIVTIYDAGEDHDLAYFAMEVLTGSTLGELSRKQGLLPPDRVAEMVMKVAEALDYAHSQGIVHRDIKPANIMVLPDGNVKVADFGVARIADAAKSHSGMVIGTPYYMSPEQLSGSDVDGRSDLYSLGVVLFEMLTGSKPFQADSVAALMIMVTAQPAPSALSIRPDLPTAFEAILARALEKDPGVRYQRGLEMARDLKAAAHASASGDQEGKRREG